MINKIPQEHPLYKYRILFNGYNPVNEISKRSAFWPSQVNVFDKKMVYYDDYYGRFYTGELLNKVAMVYGSTLNDYNHGAEISLQKVDSLRVPYRQIPVYKANNLKEIINAVKQMKRYSPAYTFLYRGQGRIYTLERNEIERRMLFGYDESLKEPSFLPSFLRQNLDYHKIVSAWHNTCSLLLEGLHETHKDELAGYRHFEKFHLLALGLAQHYGLPSVGLDLTDDIRVALWFAIYKATYSNQDHVKAELVKDDEAEPTIFVFRCSPNSIFRYSDILKNLGAHRPQNQRAFFNHCGWGLAKNQLALDLACAFRVDASFAEELPDGFIDYLFPEQKDDEVLRAFIRIKNIYKGTELGTLLEGIYI